MLHIAWISSEAQDIQSIRRTCILFPQWSTELHVQEQARNFRGGAFICYKDVCI